MDEFLGNFCDSVTHVAFEVYVTVDLLGDPESIRADAGLWGQHTFFYSQAKSRLERELKTFVFEEIVAQKYDEVIDVY